MAKKSREFGERLFSLIEGKGLNVNQLHKKTGISQSAIWAYVNEGRIPEAPILYKLSKELNVSMEGLLTGEGIEGHKTRGKIIAFGRRREDPIFEKDPEVKKKIDIFIKYWMTGDPHVRELFEMCLKTAQKLIKKEPPAKKKGRQRRVEKGKKAAM